jgi:hypothetical protein
MLQNNEIINLLLSLLLFAVFYFVIRRAQIIFPRNFLFSFIAFFGAITFTIVETFIWPVLFNILEHFFYLLTAFFFFLTIKGIKTEKYDNI